MKRFGLALYRRICIGLMAASWTLLAPAVRAQDSSSVTTGAATSHSAVTTTTTSEFVSDWRLWALVGAVVLIILIIALTRRGGGDSTTIVK
jgi:hypothetical protein